MIIIFLASELAGPGWSAAFWVALNTSSFLPLHLGPWLIMPSSVPLVSFSVSLEYLLLFDNSLFLHYFAPRSLLHAFESRTIIHFEQMNPQFVLIIFCDSVYFSGWLMPRSVTSKLADWVVPVPELELGLFHVCSHLDFPCFLHVLIIVCEILMLVRVNQFHSYSLSFSLYRILKLQFIVQSGFL